MSHSQDDTKRFISKQNVSFIQKILGSTFQEARQYVITFLQQQNGYISSLSEANEALIHQIKKMSQRPISNVKISKQDESQAESVAQRLQRMQEERSQMTNRRPIVSVPNTSENVLIHTENREEISKKTAERLEEMQRQRAVILPVPRATDDSTMMTSTIDISQNQNIHIVFHSPTAERKTGQEWWDRIWNVPELHTMAFAKTLRVLGITIISKSRSNLRHLLVKIGDLQSNDVSSTESWILTPSQTKQNNVHLFEVLEEVNESSKWTYYFKSAKQNALWNWSKKTERLHVSLIPLGIGRFWENDDILSWSIIVEWER